MKKLIKLFLLVSALTITACTSDANDDSSSYKKISAKKAKEMMDNDNSIILVDVKTKEEYSQGYIKGAILLPVSEMSTKASEILKDKSARYLLYCRSGNRSASAAKELVKAGYTDVYDFGGIISWPYEIVQD